MAPIIPFSQACVTTFASVNKVVRSLHGLRRGEISFSSSRRESTLINIFWRMQLQECGSFAPVKNADGLAYSRFITKELMCPQIFKLAAVIH